MNTRVLDPAGGIGRALARATNASLDVAVELALKESGVEQDAVHRIIEDWLEIDTVFWEASADLEEWRASVRSCSTLEELATLFA